MSTPTATQTPGQNVPSIETVLLVSGWEDFGDAQNEQIDAVGQGASALIALRYNSQAHDGTVDTTEQVRVFDESGSRVGIEDSTGEQLVDASGVPTVEYALAFDTSRWEIGDYEAEALIRDNVSGKTSETATTSFKVNRPLRGSGARFVGVQGPNSVRTGERYEFTATIENTSNRDGSVVSPVSARSLPNGEW